MKRHIFSLLVFVILTLILTYPIALNMGEALTEPGDSLFITWCLSWDLKSFFSDPMNIFSANIFYPHKYTLAYSEHMIGVAIMAVPIYVFSHNPILIYNSMLLLSFILCGWCMYLLVYNLTADWVAGITAGVIFSFCPFRFEQLGHLHVLAGQWIPCAILCLHTICGLSEKKGRRAMALSFLFGLFVFFQFLCSGHNGVYLLLLAVLFLIYFKNQTGLYPWVALIIAGIMLIPFYYPYLKLAREYGFERPIDEFKIYSPQISAYFAVHGENWIYGKFLDKYCKPEAVMFPGMAAIVLAFWNRVPKIVWRKTTDCTIILKIINSLMFVCVAVIILVLVTGGMDLHKEICGVKLKIGDCTSPMYLLLALILVKMILCKDKMKKWMDVFRNNFGPIQFYIIFALLAFLLTFGPVIKFMDKDIVGGPYAILYHFFPGFKGLRVSGRIYVLFVFALSVLAGYGLRDFRQRFKVFSYVSIILPFIICLEYIEIPIKMRCRMDTDPPKVYEWIARQPGDFAIIELPMPEWPEKFDHEIPYMYWSIYHGKKIVNGYSGYAPLSFWPIAGCMRDFPSDDSMEILNYLGVKYVVVHNNEIKGWGLPDVSSRIGQFDGKVIPFFNDGEDSVYEIKPGKNGTGDSLLGSPISKKNWNIVSNYNQTEINCAIDDNLRTRWQSGVPQSPGMCVEVDMGGIHKINSISFYMSRASTDYPRGVDIEVSCDGRVWEKKETEHIYANYVKHLVEYPDDNRLIIEILPTEARFIKITQTGRHDTFYWSIYEMDIC